MQSKKRKLKKLIGVSRRVYIVRETPILWKGQDCFGIYYENKKSHKIVIDSGLSDIQIFCTLAHELIHAWQHENNLKLKHSKNYFPQWVKYFRKNHGVDIILMQEI